MAVTTFTARQARTLQITGVCLLIFALFFGLYLTVHGKPEGSGLIVVCVVIINFVNLFQSQLQQASARIDELEKKLLARDRPQP